jgi:hypothetical protein
MEKDKVMNMVDPPNGTKDQIANACIYAGLSFFTALAGMSITQVTSNPCTALVASGISAGLAFFTSLAVQRGLVKKEQ